MALLDVIEYMGTGVRYDGIPLPSTPMTEGWCGWLLVGLALLLMMLISSAPKFISQQFATLFAPRDRRSFSNVTTSVVSGGTLILAIIYTLLSISFALYVVCVPAESCAFLPFLPFTGAVLALFALKFLAIWLLAYIFGPDGSMSTFVVNYARILFTFSLWLLPTVILFVSLPYYLHWISYIMLIFSVLYYLVILVWHIIENFSLNLLSYVYIFLYLCTLEFLPIQLLVHLY